MVETAQPIPASSVPGGGNSLPDHSVVPAVWGRITNLDVDRGEGSWLVTRDGERYLDYSSGIGVTNTGHAHPRVAAAIATQASAAFPPASRTRIPASAAAGCSQATAPLLPKTVERPPRSGRATDPSPLSNITPRSFPRLRTYDPSHSL